MDRSILFLCILCSACANVEEYPSDWSPIVVGGTECPDISGIYQNWGLRKSKSKGSLEMASLLSNYVAGDGRALSSFFEYIVISQSDADEIQSTVHSMHNILDKAHEKYHTHTLFADRGQFVCEGGKIWIAETVWGVNQLFGAEYAKTRIGLAKAEDGSLVGEIQSSGAGVVLVVIPFKYSSEYFVLWKLFEPEYGDMLRKAIEEIVVAEE